MPGTRPALEGRAEFWRQLGEGAGIEIAPGFHTSTSHVAGVSVPSHLFTLDWLIQPIAKIQFTGTFFTGQNAAGLGGLHQGFTVFEGRGVTAIGATGGWAQLSYLATRRLSFNLQGGQESDRGVDLLKGDIHRNLMYAGNAIYRLGPNVLLGLEASQVRTSYILGPSRLNNHSDVALAYLFSRAAGLRRHRHRPRGVARFARSHGAQRDGLFRCGYFLEARSRSSAGAWRGHASRHGANQQDIRAACAGCRRGNQRRVSQQ